MAEYYRVLAYGTNYNDPVYVGTYTKAEEARNGYEFFKGDRDYISVFLYEAHDFSGLIGYEGKDLIAKWENPNPPKATTIQICDVFVLRKYEQSYRYHDEIIIGCENARKAFDREVKDEDFRELKLFEGRVLDDGKISKKGQAVLYWSKEDSEEDEAEEVTASFNKAAM